MLPLTSTLNVEPLAKVTLPLFRMPGLTPGASVPPLWTWTVPLTVPVPPRTPPVTVTGLPAASEPVTSSVPWLIVVASV